MQHFNWSDRRVYTKKQKKKLVAMDLKHVSKWSQVSTKITSRITHHVPKTIFEHTKHLFGSFSVPLKFFFLKKK